MKRNKKIKVYLSKMNTEIGLIPVLSNTQTVNRPIYIYSAEKYEGCGKHSIFFIVRVKDAKELQNKGYLIQSILLMPGFTPCLIDYNDGFGTKLQQTIKY